MNKRKAISKSTRTTVYLMYNGHCAYCGRQIDLKDMQIDHAKPLRIGGLVIEKYNGTACDDWNVTGIDFCEVDPSTICQCTGLKDKNGKLIWENDIVRDEYGNFYKAFWQNDYYQFSFCAKTGVFPIGAKWNLWSFKSSEIEVVGNIFDNKELLESEG